MQNEYGAKLDRNGYAPSILMGSGDFCSLCFRRDRPLHRHEVFHNDFGGVMRKKSKNYGLWISICDECHRRIHENPKEQLRLKEWAQRNAMTVLALNANNPVAIRWKDIFAWHGDMIRRILNIAIPNGIENGLFALGKVLVVSIISLFGTVQIAANGIANSIDMISIVVVNAMNLAIVTVIGQCVGAREYDQAQYYTGKMMKISYFFTAVLGVIVCICLPLIRFFYDVSDETWRYTCILVVMHNALAAALHPTSFNLSNTLRAAGDVKYTMYAGIASMIVFRLGSAVLFAIVFILTIIQLFLQKKLVFYK